MTTPRVSARTRRPVKPHVQTSGALHGLTPEEIHEFVVASRWGQGLSPTITDPLILGRVAALIGTPRPEECAAVIPIGAGTAAGRAMARAALSVDVA